MSPLSLYELNTLVRRTLQFSLDDSYWLQAELSEVRENRGHCYVEFIQKGADGNAIVAKSRGQVWANKWALLRPYFEHVTGQRLAAGMQVLVCVQITFHELYGFALNIIDIDPAYTLGDIARRRQEILQKLKAEGVLTMNKELPLPRLLQRIAIISSPTAAGYQDFCNQLEHNPYHLAFHTRLFPATMQGDEVEQSVVAALDAIASELDEWDCVVIIRGGGSTADLNGFDTLLLAENVAQFPLPIITGIGHERDDTVIDLIAHTRVKTPTAAAEFLVQHQKNELDTVEELASRLTRQITQMLQTHQTKTMALSSRISMAATRAVAQRMTAVEVKQQKLQLAVAQQLMKQQHRLSLIENKIESASPDRLLRLGYSISRVNGHAITDASQVHPGDLVVTTLAQGEIQSLAVN